PMIRSTKKWKRTTSGLLIVVLVLGLLRAKGWAQMTELHMGVVFVNARVAPLWVAEKEGFFRRNGIDIKLTNIPGGTQGGRRYLAAESTCPLLIRPRRFPPSRRARSWSRSWPSPRSCPFTSWAPPMGNASRT